jgi:hypothetical protein
MTTFNPNSLEFSNTEQGEEQVVLVGERAGMFCLVYPVQELSSGAGEAGGDGDRTWIEGEDY